MLYNIQLFSQAGREIGMLLNVRKSNIQAELRIFSRSAQNASGALPEFAVIYSAAEYELLARRALSVSTAICGVVRRTPNRRGYSVTIGLGR